MTRAERAHGVASRFCREAIATRDPVAIATAQGELDAAAVRLAEQRARCGAKPHVYVTSELVDGESLIAWRERQAA